jgi:glycosyltransferase involved in cell wall biosynthesis
MSQPSPTSTPQPPVLSIVVPIYNEANTWRRTVECLRDAPLPGLRRQIILVDDASTDGTRQQLQEFASHLPAAAPDEDIRVLFHDRNRGKGAALRTGFAAATGELAVPQDADLEYDPTDFPRLAEPILTGRADAVYGSRFLDPANPRGRFMSYLANRFLTALSNLFSGLRLTDMETCYKMVRRDVLRQMVLEQERFGFEPEITARLAKLGARVAEVAISYKPRTREEGKKIGFKDGLWAVWCIVRYSLPRRRPRP